VRRLPSVDYLILAGFWTALVSLLLLLPLAGVGVGFSVWPLGEDRNWIDILQSGHGAAAASLFWSINDRNPLSPWWYILFEPLILNVDAGLLILRFLVGLVLSLTTYKLVREVCGGGGRVLALSASIPISVFMANGYFDQIYWNFQAALICSLWSIILFTQFLRSGRSRHGLYAGSLIMWFIAIASYTIQSGAILAIAYLSVFRPQNETRLFSAARLRAAFFDALPFAVFYLLFLLLWRTTVRVPGTYALHPAITRIASSIWLGVVHYDFRLLTSLLLSQPDTWLFIALGFAGAVAVFLCLYFKPAHGSGNTLDLSTLVQVAVIVACIFLPTILIEGSAAEWPPGTRWRMIYQFTTPMIYVIGGTLVFYRFPKIRSQAVACISAALAGIFVCFSLVQNHHQVTITRSERSLRDKILEIAAAVVVGGGHLPLQFIVKIDPTFSWYSSDALSAVYAKTWFQRDDLSFRLIPNVPLEGPYAQFWPIRFGEDSHGVSNAKLWGINFPYDRIRVLEASNRGIEEKRTLTQADLTGYKAEWERASPLQLRVDRAPCPLKWSANQDAISTGVDPAEEDKSGPFRWTTARTAKIVLPLTCVHSGTLTIEIGGALSERNLKGMVVRAWGRLVRMSASDKQPAGLRFRGNLPPPPRPGAPLELELSVPKLDELPGAARAFGVMLQTITVAEQ
jgi:hypothetical protein